MAFIQWNSNLIGPAVSDTDMEQKDLLGVKSFQMEPLAGKRSGSPLFGAKPFQILFLQDNYRLASNQGLKALDIAKDMTTEDLRELTGVNGWVQFILNPLFELKDGSNRIRHTETASALFWSSLPDVFTEFFHAYLEEKYWDIPSSVVTAAFNGPLFVFHFVAQAVQALAQVLSLPTMLTGMALRAASRTTMDEKGAKAGYIALAVLAAIVTSPFQLFSLASNTIGYVRHVVDGAVTIAKAFVNMIVDGVSGLIKLGVSSDKSTDSLKDNLKKNLGQMGYALIDTIKNGFRLIPVAVAVVVGYFTAGASFAAASITAAATVYGLGLFSQALSLINMKLGDALAPIEKWIRNKVAVIDSLLSKPESTKSESPESKKLISSDKTMKNRFDAGQESLKNSDIPPPPRNEDEDLYDDEDSDDDEDIPPPPPPEDEDEDEESTHPGNK